MRKTLLKSSAMACLIALTALPFTPSLAQEPEPESAADELIAQLDEQIEAIDIQRTEIARLTTRLAAAEGVFADLLDRRLFQQRHELIAAVADLGTTVTTQLDAGVELDAYVATVVESLQANLIVADEAWDQLDNRDNIPDPGLSAANQAAVNRSFFDTERSLNEIIGLTTDTLELLDTLGQPDATATESHRQRVLDRAINASIYLEMAQDAAADARAGLSALPGDADLQAVVTISQELVTQVATLFQVVVDELDRLGEDSAGYRQQIISATGEISPALFDFAVMRELLGRLGGAVGEFLIDEGPNMVLRIVVIVLIVYLFLKASRFVRGIVERGLDRSNANLSRLLKRMIVSFTANLVLAIGILIALSQLGISLGPLLAGLGIAGFIIGFALQDSLANFASGLMILFYRPYDVGDIIQVTGLTGTVEHMSLVNTTIHTFDNQRIIVPNSMIWTGTITNVTAAKIRRVDLVFGVSYSDDIPKTELILNEIVQSHELVLDQPEPIIKLHELADSSVNFVVRPWTRTENYWDVYWDLTRAVKLRFDEEGISIPFPQRDVHLFGSAN